MTREELRDRLAPIYRQLREIVDGSELMELTVLIRPGQMNDCVVTDGRDAAVTYFFNDLFRDWKEPTEATR